MTDQQIADVTNYVRQAWGNAAPANAGPGIAGDLRKSTDVSLYGAANGSCPSIPNPQIEAAVSDPKTGIAASLHDMTEATILQTVDQIVPKIKAAAAQAQQADIVNGLTLAYCPIVRQQTDVPHEQQVLRIGQFSERVYSELQSNGKE
jgi:hypothetical protein